jgi:hypothetical protein
MPDAPAITIDHVLEIEAPAERVWAVIVDLDAYPAWNPFVVACQSTLVAGDPIWMRVRIFRFFVQPQRETISNTCRGGVCATDSRRFRSARSRAIAATRSSRSGRIARATAPISSCADGWRRWSVGCSALGSRGASAR